MLDKFLFGNKQIPEMYFGNIPVAKVYFGNILIWEKEGYVPYDNTCIAIISLTSNGKGWIVTVEKNGEDVTSSFATMIPWIYNANNVRFNPKVRISTNTVDLSTFERGEYRLDVSQITSKVGAGSYFPGSGVVSAPDHIYIGGGNNLVAGNQNVAIEYDLTNALYPVTVNSIEIFTDSSSDSSAKIKILHECGLFIAAVDGDTKGTQEERFGLAGYSHSVDNLSVYLQKGHKYYIVYQGSTNEAFYPSHFQNENGKYKVYANTQGASQINVADLSVIGNFLGGLFSGRHPTKEDKLYMLSMSINDSFMYLGYNSTDWDPSLVQNHFYRKKSNTYKNTTEVNITSGNDHYKAAKLFGNIKKYTTVLQNGSLTNGSNYDGSIAKIATGYTSYIDVDDNNEPIALTTWPSSPQNNGLYYIDSSLLQSNSNEFVVYHNNDWDRVGQYYMDQGTITNYVDYPDWWHADFEDLNVSYTVDTNFTTNTLNTDKHFYLKINGMEV